MFEWKAEDMSLMNERGRLIIGNERIYSCEHEVSREDKVAFVDSLQDGKLSYLLGLIEKFREDKSSLPHDSWGDVKTTSLKAWIKRNDTGYSRPLIDNSYNYGEYRLLGCSRHIQTDSKGAYDTCEDFVDECFHRQLKECERAERAYFESIDEYSILSRKIHELSNQYGTTFGVYVVYSSSKGIYLGSEEGFDGRPFTIEELRELSEKYDRLAAFVDELTAETNITLEQPEETQPKKKNTRASVEYDT